MINNPISFYDKVKNIPSKETIPLDIFLDNIREGKWQDIVIPIRLIEDKEKRNEVKKKAPSVTISGKFTERTDAGLETHSGYIAVDIDNVENIEALKDTLSGDRYVASAFVSIGGRGLCLLFKISPEKHREAFQGISEYLFNSYKVICDPTSINVSRARFVSFDPNIYIATSCEKFKQYPKNKPPKKIEKIIYCQDDFSSVLNEVVSKRLNLVENYHEWLRIGFALVHKFGEQGREYFHIISQYSSKYDSTICDKQYSACLKHKGGKETTISTFFHYAKQAGVQIYSERTRKIAYSASQGKKSGLNPAQVAENLDRFEDIQDTQTSAVLEIIDQVYQSNIEINEDSLIDQLEMFIRQNYSLRRNEITRYIENSGLPMQQMDLNDIYRQAKKVLEKCSYEMIDRVIHSRTFVPVYNPLKEYFAGMQQEQPILDLKTGPHLPIAQVIQLLEQHAPLLTRLFNTISTTDPKHALYFGAKWFVGIISSVYGEHSPLMLVLSGDVQNTGKTEWLRRLTLGTDLKPYYADSKLDAGKDDEILMTQKILIMDDEMGGKSKKEVKRLKELTSKQTFSLREPYGRNNVDLERIAVLCGTTNDNEILSDPTGNRRIIPIHVSSINHEAYNSIDKNELFAEVYQLYRSGLRWRLSMEDIEYLNKDAKDFDETVLEAELLSKYFEPGTDTSMTASEIKVYIEHKTNQKLLLRRLSQELKLQGFDKKSIWCGKQARWMYMVKELGGLQAQQNTTNAPDHEKDDLPF